MFSLRGKAVLTIFLMMTLTLLAIIYHILSNDPEDSSRRQLNRLSKPENYLFPTLSVDSSNKDRKIPEFPLEKGEKKLSPIFKGQKIVHLDLKGAPPVPDYYSYFLKLLKSLGATGILIEYEDMFPYTGELANVTAGNAYKKGDIMNIVKIAGDCDLMVIPLIQTFGHMEFVLKLENFKDLREVYRYPQVICPTHPRTLQLLYDMIDQMLKIHENTKYLHIGADEVYHLGECNRCMETMANNQWTKRQLFLSHIKKISNYVKKNYPGVKILMWDDEFREITSMEIREMELQKNVVPVVWKYTKNPGATLDETLWESYSSIWGEVWVATAFKGATEPDRYWTDISYHLENHQRWLEIIERYSNRINFRGAILTGWQRYDHFSVLCELLASSLPSLAVNLAVLQSADLNELFSNTPSTVADALKCDGLVSLGIPEPNYGWLKCKFFGINVYAVIVRLFNLNQEIMRMEQDNTFKGWMKDYNIKHVYSNPSHVERAIADLDSFKMELIYIEKEMKSAMEGIYDNWTFQEWIETFVVPLNDKITRLWEAKERILEKTTWPTRPLKAEL